MSDKTVIIEMLKRCRLKYTLEEGSDDFLDNIDIQGIGVPYNICMMFEDSGALQSIEAYEREENE